MGMGTSRERTGENNILKNDATCYTLYREQEEDEYGSITPGKTWSEQIWNDVWHKGKQTVLEHDEEDWQTSGPAISSYISSTYHVGAAMVWFVSTGTTASTL